uniref:hypothetical protein n=1 Tax=Shewanella morhuae TaxID=365591 RepID=UPI003570A193
MPLCGAYRWHFMRVLSWLMASSKIRTLTAIHHCVLAKHLRSMLNLSSALMHHQAWVSRRSHPLRPPLLMRFIKLLVYGCVKFQ